MWSFLSNKIALLNVFYTLSMKVKTQVKISSFKQGEDQMKMDYARTGCAVNCIKIKRINKNNVP